ncbi:MAG: hypothetical protein R2733_05230 [Acidimicrobiales bacterium]
MMANDAPGSSLYRLVAEYGGFEHHRTGTEHERETQAWLGDHLTDRGAVVRTATYDFDQFVVAEHHVTLDGEAVEAMPLWYAGAGHHDTSDVDRIVWPFAGGNHGTDDAWASLIGTRPTVAATAGLDGKLGVPNRAPRFTLDQPVSLIAGSFAEQLLEADVRVVADFHRTTGESVNVFGRFGGESASPLVITTPMTGWFACAGERGTGIAIAIELATRLGGERPVLFVGTTGHEIGYLGVDRLVNEAGFGTPAAIVHIGASTAAGVVLDGEGTLSPTRLALSSLPAADGRAVVDAAADGGLNVLENPPDWFGEGEMLKRLDVPLLSFVGTFPDFHTPLDVVERVTTPSMLADASATVEHTVRAFLDAAG